MNTTINKIAPTKMPQLVEGSSTYKLIVPENVEEKIRYLIRKFPSTEWSGVLFIKHTGSFENNDLVITCEDLYLMDLGTSGWTEFKMNEDVAAYMAENIELFDCDLALCHSHHIMGAFFSNQDNSMLQQGGNDTNCFVSLVVDTRGKYVARITRKVKTKAEVIIKNLGTSYEFFGNGSVDISKKSDSESTKVVTKEIIEYYNLEVERHEVSNTLSYLDDRFNEIEERKKAEHITSKKELMQTINEDTKFFDWMHNDKPTQCISIDQINNSTNKKQRAWKPDSKKIHRAVCQMITCNFIINPDKIDLKQWIHKHMLNVYEKIFNSPNNIYANVNAFNEWRDFSTQYIMDYFDTSDVPDEIFIDGDVFMSIVAKAIYNELSKYESNIYIQAYQEVIAQYIIE